MLSGAAEFLTVKLEWLQGADQAYPTHYFYKNSSAFEERVNELCSKGNPLDGYVFNTTLQQFVTIIKCSLVGFKARPCGVFLYLQ
jgi:hypothetical protein